MERNQELTDSFDGHFPVRAYTLPCSLKGNIRLRKWESVRQ